MADTRATEQKTAPKADTSQVQPLPAPTPGAPAAQAKAPSAGQQARRNPAESGDPAVHQLLAERQTANMNKDEATVQRIDKQLERLGF